MSVTSPSAASSPSDSSRTPTCDVVGIAINGVLNNIVLEYSCLFVQASSGGGEVTGVVVGEAERDVVQIPELPKNQTPTVDLEQESEKSPLEILKIKKEQVEKQKMPKFTIKSIDKAALKEFDQKSSLYQTMHANKECLDTIKDHKRKHDDDEDPPVRPNQGKKRKRRRSKESESSKKPSTTKETPKVVVGDDDQPQDTSEPKTTKTPNLEWFTQPPRPPTPDPEWNKRQVVPDQPEQHWFNQMVSTTKDPLTFNELMATLIDFSKYVLDRLKIDNLTQDILLGLVYNMLKGTCSSSVKLEYYFQECFNALIDKLDWNNPKGDRYPFDLSKPLPLQDCRDEHYLLKTKAPTPTPKAARYEIDGIEDMGEGRKLWHRSQMNKFSKHNVYSTKKILEFKESNFVDLHLNDIEDMLFVAVQHKLFHLTDSDIVTLCMFTRSLVIKKRVEDLQLGVESYHKKLNITPPQQTIPEIEFKEPYTSSHNPPRAIYEDLTKQKRVMRADELYKFSDETLKKV
ncbi:hypothetical protein Tco_1120720 [Tanacetum coccineum]